VNRINFLLLAILIVSSMGMVQIAYEDRRLFAATEKAKTEAARLKIEEIRLLAMREEQATHLRIDKVARERLHMQTATPAVTLYMDAVASRVVAP
jgi:cell division protein FtsL